MFTVNSQLVCQTFEEKYRDQLKQYHTTTGTYYGYLSPMGLLFVPFGTFIEVYDEKRILRGREK